jgi:hypothetical protein
MSEWTVETLKELVDQRFTDMDRAITAALAAQKELTGTVSVASEKAIVKAENAQNAHNVLANGLQGRLDEQAKHMIARPEFDQRVRGLEEKINDLRESRSGQTGRGVGLSQGWGYLVGALGIGLALLSFLMRLAGP